MGLETLRVDFAMNRGHEMIVDREPGITREQLDEVETHMLQGQRIPKLLEVEWIDIDGHVTFRYPLNGKRMLSHKLQAQSLTMSDFYALLLAVVEAIDDSQHYMLRSVGFMLHEQYVFVGEQWQDIGLVYVPLRGEGVVPSAGEAVLAMAVRWIGHIEQPDGTGLQRVFQHLKGEHVAWGALRQTLLTLASGMHYDSIGPVSGTDTNLKPVSLSTHVPNRGQKIHPLQNEKNGQRYIGQQKGAVLDGKSAAEAANARPGISSTAVPAFQMRGAVDLPESQTAAANNHIHVSDADELPLMNMDEEKAAANHSRQTWMLGAAFILAVGLIWRYLYLASPTRTSLLLSLGLTLMAGAGVLYYRRQTNNNENDDDSVEENWRSGEKWDNDDDGFVPNSTVLSRGKMSSIRENQLSAWDASAATNNSTLAAAAGASASNRQYDAAADASAPNWQYGAAADATDRPHGSPMRTYESERQVMKSVPGQTAVQDRNQDVTVLLGRDSSSPGEMQQPQPWLEREAEGKAEKVNIQPDRFVIGRSAEASHFVDASSGISRTHIELLADQESWSAKDVGSRNGSTLNGESMIPYKGYTLRNGDTLQLAGENGPKYKFRAG